MTDERPGFVRHFEQVIDLAIALEVTDCAQVHSVFCVQTPFAASCFYVLVIFRALENGGYVLERYSCVNHGLNAPIPERTALARQQTPWPREREGRGDRNVR